MNEDDKFFQDASMSNTRNEANTMGGRLMRWIRQLPRRVRTYGPDVVGTAGVIGVVAWEWRNASLGFEQLFQPGIVWSVLAGIAVCLLALFFHRTGMEEFRKSKIWTGTLMMVLAVLTSCVVWVGVWSNLAADSLNMGEKKIEERAERAQLVARIQRLERSIDLMADPIGIDTDREALKYKLNVAKQWDMPDLDPDGACSADLDYNRRAMCDEAAQIREEISLGEDMIKAKEKKREELNGLREELLGFKEHSGAEHFEEMAAIISKREDWKIISNLVILAISIILFVAAAFGNDYLAEKRERKPMENA